MHRESRHLLPSREVKTRLGGVSDMTLWRWQHNPAMAFPKPVIISRRKYWDAAEIDSFIAAQRSAPAAA